MMDPRRLSWFGTPGPLAFILEREGYQVAVADDGPGSPSDIRLRNFSAGFTTKEGGTGLGLAIVKHLVGLMGGEVHAANRPTCAIVRTASSRTPSITCQMSRFRFEESTSVSIMNAELTDPML